MTVMTLRETALSMAVKTHSSGNCSPDEIVSTAEKYLTFLKQRPNKEKSNDAPINLRVS